VPLSSLTHPPPAPAQIAPQRRQEQRQQGTNERQERQRVHETFLLTNPRRGYAGCGMALRYVLSDYLEQAMAQAVYDKLEDGSFAGGIPACPGVAAFGASVCERQHELRSTLEEWKLLGLKPGHPLPVAGGMDLNREPLRKAVDTL